MDPHLKELMEMLTYRRPHKSASERKFINRFIIPLGVKRDAGENYYKIVGNDDEPILWSCHLDTVHWKSGRQRLHAIGNDVMVHPSDASNCLGADDCAGIWLLIQMIRAGVPGLYVFHRQEEHGCVGSTYFNETQKGLLLRPIKAAIAFDRKGTDEVITHQLYGRTASDAFAQSMCDALGMGHEPSDRGVYTDTASYSETISECTNISAGYRHEHTKKEFQDVEYLMNLREACLHADFTQLVFERDPTVVDPPWWKEDGYHNYGGGYQTSTGTMGDGDTYIGGGWYKDAAGVYHRVKDRPYDGYDDDEEGDIEDIGGKNAVGKTMKQLVMAHPEAVADILLQYGYSADSLTDDINGYYCGQGGFRERVQVG